MVIQITEVALLRFKSKEVGSAGIEDFLWGKPTTGKFRQLFRKCNSGLKTMSMVAFPIWFLSQMNQAQAIIPLFFIYFPSWYNVTHLLNGCIVICRGDNIVSFLRWTLKSCQSICFTTVCRNTYDKKLAILIKLKKWKVPTQSFDLPMKIQVWIACRHYNLEKRNGRVLFSKGS